MFETVFSTELLFSLSILASPWLLFALFAALGDASVGFIDEWLLKTISGDQEKVASAPGKLLLISGFFGFVVSLGAVLLVYFVPSLSLAVSTYAISIAMLAGFIEVLWLLLYFIALQQGGAVNTTPLFQSIPIFALIFGVILFNEIPSLLNLLATCIIIIGAFVLNYSNKEQSINYRGVLFMFMASALIALGLFVFKTAEAESNFITTVIGNGLGMGIMSVLIWTAHPTYRKQFNSFIVKFDYRVIVGQFANESLYSLSALFGQMAVILGPSVMVVSAFNAFHPIFTLLIGWILAKFGSTTYKEVMQPNEVGPKVLGIILIVLGSILIVF